MGSPHATPEPPPPPAAGRDVARLRDLSAQQWKSGAAAWLGWLFDGLDMHLYVLVAAPFVSELLRAGSEKDSLVGYYSLHSAQQLRDYAGISRSCLPRESLKIGTTRQEKAEGVNVPQVQCLSDTQENQILLETGYCRRSANHASQ